MYSTDKPVILITKNESKTASSGGVSAKLHCRALGAPKIRFSWEREGLNITNMSEKYILEEKRVSFLVFLLPSVDYYNIVLSEFTRYIV